MSNSTLQDYKPIIAIGVPVHGFSRKLCRSIKAISRQSCFDQLPISLFIVNSGDVFSPEVLGGCINRFSLVIIDSVKPNFYWAASVERIYDLFHSSICSHLLLINHDCNLSPSCLENLLLANASLGANSVCHSVVLDARTHAIWWAGTHTRGFSRHKFLYRANSVFNLPPSPYLSDSAMGQTLLMPKSAVKQKWLYASSFPHYFADSVQTSHMRRNGCPVYVIPDAISYTDQSDLGFKKQWLEPITFHKLFRSYLHPKSSRNLLSSYLSEWHHYDRLYLKIIMSFYVASGKFLKALSEFLQLNFSLASIMGTTSHRRKR